MTSAVKWKHTRLRAGRPMYYTDAWEPVDLKTRLFVIQRQDDRQFYVSTSAVPDDEQDVGPFPDLASAKAACLVAAGVS